MKTHLAYRFSSSFLIALVLSGLLWTNLISYCSWFSDLEPLCLELYDPIEESEKEEKKSEEDKYNDLQEGNAIQEAIATSYRTRMFHSIDLKSLYWPSMPTPPPECSNLI